MRFYRDICSLCYWKRLRTTQPAYHLRLLVIFSTVLMILLIAYFSDPITQRRSPISAHQYHLVATTLSLPDLEKTIRNELTRRLTTIIRFGIRELLPPLYIEQLSILI